MRILMVAAAMSLAAAAVAQTRTDADNARNATISGEKHSVRVTGYGEVSLTPDIAYAYFGVTTRAEQAEDAVAANSTQVQKVLDTLAGYGIAQEDIRTINFSIHPRQEYDQHGQPTVVEYVVQNTVWVTMRNLGQVGEILDAVISAGATTVSGLQFDLSDRNPAYAQALDAAVQGALRKAQILARSAGVTLGEVLSLDTVYGGSYTDAGRDEGGVLGGSDPTVPISPGELKVTASVTAVYEIY